MHHKFAVVDDLLLLTGSFNWTYNSNSENLLILQSVPIVQSFQEEFARLKAKARRIFQVSGVDAKVFAAFPLFQNTLFSLADLRKKVSTGIGVWTVGIKASEMEVAELFFKRSVFPFDPTGLMRAYWARYRVWSAPRFHDVFRQWKSAGFSQAALRNLWCWTVRIKTGDLVFLTEKRSGTLLAIGIVQSEPQPYDTAGFSCFRAIQCLHRLSDRLYLLPGNVSKQAVARYRGSALRVLQEVTGE